MSTIGRLMAQVRHEIEAKPLLWTGLITILFLGVLYLFAAIGTWKAALQQQFEQKQAERIRIAQIASEQDWRNRAQQAQRALAAARARIPSSDSQGLAQATYQAWLRRQVHPFAPTARIDVAAPVPVIGVAGLWKIDAVLSAGSKPVMIMQILSKLQQAEQLTSISSLRIVQTPQSNVQMRITGYYFIGHKQ